MAGNKKDDMTKVGVLFSKESKKGVTFFTGSLENGTKLVAFIGSGKNKETGEVLNIINIYEQQELEATAGPAKKTKAAVGGKKLPF